MVWTRGAIYWCMATRARKSYHWLGIVWWWTSYESIFRRSAGCKSNDNRCSVHLTLVFSLKQEKVKDKQMEEAAPKIINDPSKFRQTRNDMQGRELTLNWTSDCSRPKTKVLSMLQRNIKAPLKMKYICPIQEPRTRALNRDCQIGDFEISHNFEGPQKITDFRAIELTFAVKQPSPVKSSPRLPFTCTRDSRAGAINLLHTWFTR